MAETEIATFAGGCFWCMQPPFDTLKGVTKTLAGYAGGNIINPSYQQVCNGTTGHTEVIQIHFDPAQVSYAELLDVFWKNIDPTTLNQQFHDKGTQYRTAIFYHSEEQRQLAEASKEAMNNSGKFDAPIVTEITPLNTFYPAEEYHQDYYQKNPLHYERYHVGSGRKAYLEKTWGQKSKDRE